MFDQWFIFAAYNTESQYGYGNESEAIEYCNYLNQELGINCYQFEPLTDESLIQDLENNRTDGFNLQDSLADIDNQQPMTNDE